MITDAESHFVEAARGSPNRPVVVVTGASSGIGRACANSLASPEARVVVIARNTERLANVVQELEERGAEPLSLRCDVADPSALERSFGQILERFGRVDALVSAVAREEHGGLLDVETEAFREALEVTAVGAFRLCRLCANQMVRQGSGGKIVLIGSLHATEPFPGAIAYNAAEAALLQLGRTMAHELAAHRINVNVVVPGWIDTPGERRWYSENDLRHAAASLPWGRLGRPEDVAAVVRFLVSADADYISGATLRVDGALSASLARLPALTEA